MFIGLNPSTADETKDDPTVRRCIGFAKRWGYGGIYMLNLFAFRSTDPKKLLEVPNPYGPENSQFLRMYAESAGVIVAAWGAFPLARERGRFVEGIVTHPLYCLGTTKSGAPRHPLYVPYTNMIRRWSGDSVGGAFCGGLQSCRIG